MPRRALEELGARYERLFSDASAISHDALEEAAAEGRAKGAADERARQAEKRADAAARNAARTPALEDRKVGEVGGRDLVKVAGGRLLHKLRPHRP